MTTISDHELAAIQAERRRLSADRPQAPRARQTTQQKAWATRRRLVARRAELAEEAKAETAQ